MMEVMTHPVICQECHEIFDANNSTSRLRHHEGETHVRACIHANQKILLNRWDLKEDKKKGRR